MKILINHFLIFVLLLSLVPTNVLGLPCDDNVSPVLDREWSEVVLEEYQKKITDLPKELELALQEKLIQEPQLRTYLGLQKKWDGRGKILGTAFKNSKIWRKMIENPKFMTDYASNVVSGAATTVVGHLPYLKADAVADTPLLTVDLLAGLITDSELSFIAAKNASYLAELRKRGLIEPSKFQKVTAKMNVLMEKLKAISFKKYLKRRKKIELKAETSADEVIKKSRIPSKYIPDVKKHLKGMFQLSYYFAAAGAINGMAYKGLQAALGKIGYPLDAPYEGFSVATEAFYFAEFSVHAYARIILTDKLVGKTRSMVDDFFEGVKAQNMIDPRTGMLSSERAEFFNTMKYFFLGASTVGIYFISNYLAADIYIRWRQNNFDLGTLLFPYGAETQEYEKEVDGVLKDAGNIQKELNQEIQTEFEASEEYQWMKDQPTTE